MKEQTRSAARNRREKENVEFNKLCKLLPLPNIITDQLDKASIIRLLITYLNLKNCFQDLGILTNECDNSDTFRELGSSLVLGLHGFLIVMKIDGIILYVSEAVSVYLGYSQTEVIGHNVADFVHSSDANMILSRLISAARTDSSAYNPKTNIDFAARFRSTLPKRNSGLTYKFNNEEYKVVNFQGFCCHKDTTTSRNRKPPLVQGLVTTFPSWSSTDVKLSSSSFVTHLSMDFKILYGDNFFNQICDQRLQFRQSLYDHVHASDLALIRRTHQIVVRLGQATAGYYRFLVSCDKYIWVVSDILSTAFGKCNDSNRENCNNGSAPYFICVTQILSRSVQIN